MNNLHTVVLDDDPTGTQSVSDVPVILDWSNPAVLETANSAGALYMLTNSRALDPAEARACVRHAVLAVHRTGAKPQFVLRGDSTLRGHMLEEYLAVHDVLKGAYPPYVLVPALPSAGRVTVSGVHYIARDGRRQPLADTEYARDPAFAYRSSDLLAWAEERSGGFFAARVGTGLSLQRLRDKGPQAVADRIEQLARSEQPVVFVPDAETDQDVALIGEGIRRLLGTPAQPIVRSAPALAAHLSGQAAHGLSSLPLADDGVIVVCGSHVPTTTRQLERLERRHPGTLITADVEALDSTDPSSEIRALAVAADASMATHGLAVVATSRTLSVKHSSLDSSRRIADRLARVLHEMTRLPRTIIAKGGITSAVIARTGLKAAVAHAEGPVLTGLARWTVEGGLGRRALIVFPGNVGDPDTLAHLIDQLRGTRA